jgi:tetratricopeptide (TPR) repeat protein
MTKYNTYYNGKLAYIDGSLEKEEGNKDNFTELLPLYTVNNKNSKSLGASNFQKAIEKCQKAIQLHSIHRRPIWNKNRKKSIKDKEWLNRKEYNPSLWKAWMLMGRSQFHMGAFEDAASTFSYMSRLYATQPLIYGKARAWLAKSYIEQGLMYDAEDVIKDMYRDSVDWRAQKEWDYTLADYYIHTGEFTKAIPYMRKVVAHEMRNKQKAREWFIIGQLEAALSHHQEAYKAFKHVIKLNPPYELEFNARIAMTEVLASSQTSRMTNKLYRMAESDNNKEYLDQIYYAIGNIFLAKRDTVKAIQAYEQGNTSSVRNGIEKGTLLLHLGNLYWTKEEYSDARRCFRDAIGMLDQEHPEYEKISDRSRILDALVPYIEAIHLQDSIQGLAAMSEKDRNAAIDRVIAEYKKNAKSHEEEMPTILPTNNMSDLSAQSIGQKQENNRLWYFYNPTAVAQGKITFQKIWGKRENTDHWQRSNTTVVSTDSVIQNKQDELAVYQNSQETIRKNNIKNDSLNPLKRAYYLAQIPFSKEQKEASNKIIEDALYHAGIIFKDELNNLNRSEKYLVRLVSDYPKYEKIDDAYYNLFLLYSLKKENAKARYYSDALKRNCPKSVWAEILSNPNYIQNAKMEMQLEDSLYAATYNAFKESRYQEVTSNEEISKKKYPLGANRDKFIFIAGLNKLHFGDLKGCMNDMKVIVETYPNSRISEIAGMIINGVDEGRTLKGGKFDMNSIWKYRSETTSDSDSITKQTFINSRDIEHLSVMVYDPDSINENQLLFEVAKFNFTTYLVRNFNISIKPDRGMHRMIIDGFQNFDEALQYTRALRRHQNIMSLLKNSDLLVISRKNLDLIGPSLSYEDYKRYYTKHFAPLKISTFNLLTEPTEIITNDKVDTKQPTVEDVDRILDDDIFIGIPKSSGVNNKIDKNKKDVKSTTSSTKEKEKEVTNNIDDEYYDLEGF